MGLRTVIQGGVGRFLNKGLELQLGPDLLQFETEDEFKRFLKSRASAAAESLAQMKNLPPDRLERQLRRNERIYKHTLGLLLQVVEHDTPVDMLWRELDISELPDEQQWPAILFAVSSNDELPDALKRETVERFVEFLRARKAMILRLKELANGGDGNDNQTIHQQTAEFDSNIDAHPPVDESADDRTGAAMTAARNYQRMSGMEPLQLELEEGESVNIYLSRWKVSLCIRAGSAWLEENGNSFPLQLGENSIGRASGCKVALANAPLDVSRKHLLIDWAGGGQLTLRDVSSKGTWLPGIYFERGLRSDLTTGH